MNRHQALFAHYVESLSLAKAAAEQWWAALLAAETQQLGSPEAAQQAVLERWPFGPTSHPYVIAVYRECFIACERINAAIEAGVAASPPPYEAQEDDWGAPAEAPVAEDNFWQEESPISPNVLLVDMLAGGHPELEAFISFLVFPAIGEEDERSV